MLPGNSQWGSEEKKKIKQIKKKKKGPQLI